MSRVVLLGPTEGVGALGLGLAKLAAAALGHALHTQRDRTIAIHIIQAPEAELLGWVEHWTPKVGPIGSHLIIPTKKTLTYKGNHQPFGSNHRDPLVAGGLK